MSCYRGKESTYATKEEAMKALQAYQKARGIKIYDHSVYRCRGSKHYHFGPNDKITVNRVKVALGKARPWWGRRRKNAVDTG